MGFLDWLTTIVGVLYFGAVEINPLFSSLTRTSLLAFSCMKLSVTMLVGFLFYRGCKVQQASSVGSRLERRFLASGYFASLMTLMFVVTNNILTVARVI
jgi:hypothetical protein